MKQARVKMLLHLFGLGGSKIQIFLRYRKHSFAVTLTWKHLNGWQGLLHLAPLLSKMEHAPKCLKFSVDAADFEASGFAHRREWSNCLRGDGVQASAG